MKEETENVKWAREGVNPQTEKQGKKKQMESGKTEARKNGREKGWIVETDKKQNQQSDEKQLAQDYIPPPPFIFRRLQQQF